MHVHALVCVCWQRSQRSSESRMDACVCAFGGGGLKTRGPDSAAAGQITPPKKVGHCTLALCDGKARQGGERGGGVT